MARTPDHGVSGWQRDTPAAGAAPAAPAPALSADTEADVVVVGAGLAGLMLAYQLSRNVDPTSILVVEAGRAGGGASGRSTGIVGPGVGGPITGLVRRYGPEVARRMFAASLAGIEVVRAVAAELPHDSELVDSHQVMAAVGPAHAGQLRQQAETLRGLGFEAEFWDRGQTVARLGSARFHGGLCFPDVALVNPWRLCQALRAALLASGVRIAEHTPVTALVGGDPVTLLAGGHRVRARRVALATDGFTPELGLFRHTVATIRTHVLRTEVLPPGALAGTGWDGAGAVIDSRSFFNYFRLTADGRLLFGGGPAILEDRATDRGVAAVRARLGRELAEVFPTLADVPVTDFWSGMTASTFDRLPIVGPVPGQPGVWFTGAWCGHGLSLSALSAKQLAPRLVEGVCSAAPAAGLPWLRGRAGLMPSGPLGGALLAGYLRWLDLADRRAIPRPVGPADRVREGR